LAPRNCPDNPTSLLHPRFVQYLTATFAGLLLVLVQEKTKATNTAAITIFLGKREKCLINVFINFIFI
jgi:hypothetical protein